MKEKFCWAFPIDEAGEIEGLNEGDIETFLNDPLLSISKECAQNSLDARASENSPVLLEFSSFSIKKEDFPDYKKFDKILENQIKFWGQTKKDKSSESFFKKAKEVLNSKEISCLRISDFNTTGLGGAMKEEEPFTGWKKLVKSTGVSDNPSGAGGSFGLGKHASFACSCLRTVLYNTMDLEKNEAHQGVAHLATCKDEDGKSTRRRGYYGIAKNYSNIKGKLILDDKFIRNETGTDIYILGFNNFDTDWKDKIITSLLDSFLLAIYKGDLIFKIDGEKIDKSSLGKIIERYSSKKYRDLVKESIIDYYNILSGMIHSEEYYASIFEKNDTILTLAKEEGLCNKISMNRSNGMKIFDKLKSKGVEDYAGILLLKGKKVNEYFRKLENPEHNRWFANRGSNPTEANKKIKMIFDVITDSVNKMADNDSQDDLDAEGMGEYLPDDFDEKVEKRKKIEDIPWEIHQGVVQTNNKKIKTKMIIKTPGGSPGGGRNNTSGGNNSLGGPGEDETKESKKEVTINSIRAFFDKNNVCNLIFSLSEEHSAIEANILISGETETEAPVIEEAKLISETKEVPLHCSGNKISIGQVSKDKLNKVEFKLKNSGRWTLEVELYEN